jgi:CxxC motif-containing protein (DUF1111 family)
MISLYRHLRSACSMIALAAGWSRESTAHPLRKFAFAMLATPLLAAPALAQTDATASSTTPSDPGPRPVGNNGQPADANGNAGAGHPLANLTNDQTTFWVAALGVFGEPAVVAGPAESGTITGLGPAFNGNSCFMCHSFPAIGGTSPPTINPQTTVATLDGATNTLPSFVFNGGPIREARFVTAPGDGLPNGAVRELFSIQNRGDAPADCTLAQPNFPQQLAANNVIFRIPTPTFGEGYVENTPDSALQDNLDAVATATKGLGLGIAGKFNRSPNDGTISRFGWKAQNKSVLLFAGEAANVELGVTNELFPNERIEGVDCTGNNLPEDTTNIVQPSVLASDSAGDDSSLVSSDIVNFGLFMRLNSAPGQCAFDSGLVGGNAVCTSFADSKHAANIADGQTQFNAVGCVFCHTETLTTAPSPFGSLDSVTYHPFSDFALHDMGINLADGVVQGNAAGNDFRTAPLWGIGQRAFFLHDGRASDLVTAICQHAPQPANNSLASPICAGSGVSPDSEANAVIAKFNALAAAHQQNILDFLRSL